MFHSSDYKYFDKARQVATISDYNKTHIGCIAVYQGQVIGLGLIVIKPILYKNIIIDIDISQILCFKNFMLKSIV